MLIDDGQIIVLGGLIQDSQGDSTQKLPFLGDIPVAGALFRYDKRTRSKTNLMVFLRPTIVRGAISTTLTTDRYDYVIGEQKAIRTDPNTIPPILPDMGDPRLPPKLTPGSQMLPPSSTPLPSLLPWGAPAPEPAKPTAPEPAPQPKP